jgi:hypothetical protein
MDGIAGYSEGRACSIAQAPGKCPPAGLQWSTARGWRGFRQRLEEWRVLDQALLPFWSTRLAWRWQEYCGLPIEREPAMTVYRRPHARVTLLVAFMASAPCLAQQATEERVPVETAAGEVPKTVEVRPATEDAAIAQRLERILAATGWFEQADVTVEEGVVFLSGRATDQDSKEWAGHLATNTRDVVAVVNRIAVAERSLWDFGPAWQQLRELLATATRNLPIVLLAVALLVATWLVSKWVVRIAASVLERRYHSGLLSQVAARAIAVPVFLLGLYLVLTVSGLTGLAVTVLGGTGLAGLIIGFAFRDIAENFLASILISMQRPFATGDLVEVEGFRGLVQSVNTRSTLLMTLDGNCTSKTLSPSPAIPIVFRSRRDTLPSRLRSRPSIGTRSFKHPHSRWRP